MTDDLDELPFEVFDRTIAVRIADVAGVRSTCARVLKELQALESSGQQVKLQRSRRGRLTVMPTTGFSEDTSGTPSTTIVGITAIVLAFKRIEQTLLTIQRIRACVPRPAEILVHVDGNQVEMAAAIRQVFNDVRVIESQESVGPGGGANKLVAAALHEIIAAFDDDSFPYDLDYFRRAECLARSFPDASLFEGAVFERKDGTPQDRRVIRRAASFQSGGAIYRRSAFTDAGGYVPLKTAYGMEEEDLSLRIFHRNGHYLHSPWLRIFHDSDLRHHTRPDINASALANLALLVFLRYPLRYWPYGVLQLANRLRWCMKVRRLSGLVAGVLMIPSHLWRHRTYRKVVSPAALTRRARARKEAFESFEIAC